MFFKYYLTQVYSRSQTLYIFLMPSYVQLSFQVPPITSVLALLFMHIFFFPPPISLPVMICLSVVHLWQYSPSISLSLNPSFPLSLSHLLYFNLPN